MSREVAAAEGPTAAAAGPTAAVQAPTAAAAGHTAAVQVPTAAKEEQRCGSVSQQYNSMVRSTSRDKWDKHTHMESRR